MNTKYLLRGLWLAGLTIGFASCQNDEIESLSDSSAESVKAITLTALMGNGIESRAMIELGNQDEDAEYIQWNEGDVLIVQNLGQDGTDTSGKVYKFEISSDYSDDSPSNSATFICTEAESNAISEGDVLCAFYLGIDATIDDYTNYLSINDWPSFTSYTEDEIKEYLKDNMYMVGKTTFSESGTSLSMKQLTSMLRVTYNNATDSEQTISYMYFTGSNSWIGWYMYYDVVNETYDIWGWESHAWIDFTEGLTVGAYESVDIYYLCFPSYEEFTSSDYVYVGIGGEEVWLKTSDIPTTTFDIGYRYWFDVTKYDTGLEWTNYELIFDDYTTIYSGTNDALCEELLDMISYSYIDDDGNLQMPTEIVESTTSLSFWNCELTSLDGIECFTNLEYLYCIGCGLTNLDVSALTNLKELHCWNNNLTSLDLSSNTALEYLGCDINEIETLNVTNCSNLTYIDCSSNNLSSLDVSGCTELYHLDVDDNPGILYLDCSGTKITSLDLSGDTELIELYCDSSQLSELDILEATALTGLTCGNQTDSDGNAQTLTLSLYQDQYDTICDSEWQADEKNSNVEFNISASPIDATGSEGTGSVENFNNGGIF